MSMMRDGTPEPNPGVLEEPSSAYKKRLAYEKKMGCRSLEVEEKGNAQWPPLRENVFEGI